ncbi:MAG: carbamoyltransferase HypF [Candidatus Omnitrophica bacterium]|nr:carbamoyltransferase HypF [Candidatus Omnitrophota bacterium]MDE2222838.1 carbamoyltransferase HypF [Candidatus Omnitrophota bacterium]
MKKSLSLRIRGTVQGVGFRPWIYRLANQLHLKGFVRNTSQGAAIQVEGSKEEVDKFVHKIRTEPPKNCVITQCQQNDCLPQGFQQFQILASQRTEANEALVLPDIAACPECLREIFDPNDRRFLYPFTNCTHCGPRYSIIEALPYDRKNTSMKKFGMCPECRQEYGDPSDRRFHAQPNACPVCGPRLSLWDDRGRAVATAAESLPVASDLIKRGLIMAVKALGGFYLMADAANDDVLAELRRRKARPSKPLAVMMPDLSMISQYCLVSHEEALQLKSPQAPIVLLRTKNKGLKVSGLVAPENPYLGCMLPAMPLMHILSRMTNRPVVATSGNLSEEPICIDNSEALVRLSGIADFFLIHDRPIVRHVDDSIAQIVDNKPMLLRRARGWAPLPVAIRKDCDGILAVGGHQKNSIALGVGDNAVISQHIGDLDNSVSSQAFERTIAGLKSIYDAPIKMVVCDKHPDYTSSQWAHDFKKGTASFSEASLLEIQHHHAHVASVMAEQGIPGQVLGICWDGSGYGDDSTIWGGEFLLTEGVDYQRFGHLCTFALPGGESAVREPRRSALGLLFQLCGGHWEEYKDLPSVLAFKEKELAIIQQMIKKGINTPKTSSMGRLFDGVASLAGLCQQASFEGQAAMALEFQATQEEVNTYAFQLLKSSPGWLVDWSGIIKGVIADIREDKSPALISTRFHQTLVEIIVDIARAAGLPDTVLSGGCFQNRWLLEHAVRRLRQEGFQPHWPIQAPVNDGGISLGQIFIAAGRNTRGKK